MQLHEIRQRPPGAVKDSLRTGSDFRNQCTGQQQQQQQQQCGALIISLDAESDAGNPCS
jgi:hypothetical protein